MRRTDNPCRNRRFRADIKKDALGGSGIAWGLAGLGLAYYIFDGSQHLDTMSVPFATVSPLTDDRARPRVVAAFGEDAYATARAALAGWDLSVWSGAKVLLKPNAGRVVPANSGVDTSPEVVAAAIDAFREAGALPTVGDSPIAGVGPLEALESSGIADVARGRGVPLLDLDERPAVTLPLPQGLALKRVKICADVLEHDVVVSIPVTKTHMHTGVTLAVKNMKGCLWRRSKVTLHMLPPVEGMAEKPLDIAIAELARVLRPHFSLVDGTTGLEGLGPGAGTPVALGMALTAVDPFAADAVACALMGRRAEAVPHLRLGAAWGLGVIELSDIAMEPEDALSHAKTFQDPPTDLHIEFPDVRVLDKNSCSACQSTLLMFLRRYGKEIRAHFPGTAPIPVAIGKGHSSLEPGTLCLGNCTLPHRERGLHAPGCPPVPSAIFDLVAGGANRDEDEQR